MTKLTWNKYWEIAEYLDKAHPEMELSNIKRVDILRMIRQIPDFGDTLNPTDDDINSLIYSWMNIKDTEAETTI